VVEQLGSTFNFSKSNEKKNLEAINILKKPIKASNRMEESKRAQKVQAAQEAQVAKEDQEVRLRLEVKGIFQVAKEVAWVELEVKWAKVRAQQVEEPLSVLSVNAMAKALRSYRTWW